MKCSPYTLKMHSTNSNQVLQCWNVDTCTSNASKYLQRAPIQNLCTSKLDMASKTSKLRQSSSKLLQGSKSASKNAPEVKTPKSTNPAFVHLQTRDGLQSSLKLLQGSKKRFQEPSRIETCTSNKHKTSRSLLMHTINQTSNHATHMSGPITC